MQRAFAQGNYATWLDGIRRTHQRRVLVRVLDLNHNRISSTERILDGQVTIDTTRDVTRVLNLKLSDPSQSIGWEPDSASAVAVHQRRMVQIIDYRNVALLDEIGVACFTGPVVDFDRDGAEVNIVCEGKERLALGNFGRAYSWPKGRTVTSVIRDIAEITGEHPSRIHLPRIAARLPERLNVTRLSQPWVVMKRLARSVNRVLYYDGRGHLMMKAAPRTSTLTVDFNSLKSAVRVDREQLEFHNRWIVLGARPKGAKRRVQADIRLPSSHGLSAYSLGRGTPRKSRWLIEQTVNDQIKTRAKARAVAIDQRDEQLRQTSNLSFDCLPFPHIDEHDLIRVVDPLMGAHAVRLNQATIPLVGGDGSIGYIKQTALVKRGRGGRR